MTNIFEMKQFYQTFIKILAHLLTNTRIWWHYTAFISRISESLCISFNMYTKIFMIHRNLMEFAEILQLVLWIHFVERVKG